jgi:AraC family transcriptional regulator
MRGCLFQAIHSGLQTTDSRFPQTWQKLLLEETRILASPTAAPIQTGQTRHSGVSTDRIIATGEGWKVLDILCTYGPDDHPFEERFAATSISLVLSGSFVYRCDRGSWLMSSGALLLGNAGDRFECSHQHSEGDRCLSFQFDPGFFERIAHAVGAKRPRLNADRLPPLRDLAPLSVRASIAAGTSRPSRGLFYSLEEIALELAGAALELTAVARTDIRTDEARGAARISPVLRRLESGGAQPDSLAELASTAGLSRYHFLRTFKRLVGVTPHQWLLRARLRDAARRLVTSRAPITEIALDAGFDDLSNFIRSFRAEFGVPPRRYRSIA